MNAFPAPRVARTFREPRRARGGLLRLCLAAAWGGLCLGAGLLASPVHADDSARELDILLTNDDGFEAPGIQTGTNMRHNDKQPGHQHENKYGLYRA